MTNYRPVSKIGVYDPDLDTLYEEIQPWMTASLIAWLQRMYRDRSRSGLEIVDAEWLRRMERVLRLRARLNWESEYHAASGFEACVGAGGSFGMDAVGFAVSDLDPTYGGDAVADVNKILWEAGSAWEAAFSEDAYRLTRRDLKAAKDAITAIQPLHERAHSLLVDAWGEIATRNPDPNGGYDKAVKAVEAAAQPVVQPKHEKATLGTILGELKAHKESWTFELGDVDLVIAMAERVWTTHIRHGTDPRTDHTLPEADAALHLAISLVRFFAGGLVRKR